MACPPKLSLACLLGQLGEQYTACCNAVIRPPRDHYEPEDLGPTVFRLQGRIFTRRDVALTNARGQNIFCSHFEPIARERVAEKLPCVVYLHGNSSSRMEAVQTLPVLLPGNMTVFCFDFTGCGISDGEYISLGYYERDDIAAVVEYLRESGGVSTIGLWGRSMGAVAALMHAERDNSIAALVLDSPFSDLQVLCEELVHEFTSGYVPSMFVGVALQLVRGSIRAEANFDIGDVTPIKHVSTAFIPALFVAAENDIFIRPHHTKELHEAYAGEKKLVMVEGDHNSARATFFLDSVAIFFFNCLQCGTLPSGPLAREGRLPFSRIAPEEAVPELFARTARAHRRSIRQQAQHGVRPRRQALGLQMQPPERFAPLDEPVADDQMQRAIELSMQDAAGTQ